jgi:hypothetical protein
VTGVQIIVKDRNIGVLAAELRDGVAEGFALPQVPIQGSGQYENLIGSLHCFAAKHAIETVIAGILAGMHDQRGQAHARCESQNVRHRPGERFGLRPCASPVWVMRKQIAGNNE